MRFNICCFKPALAGVWLAASGLAMPGALAAHSTLDLVCTGNSYGKLGDPFPNSETVTFQKQPRKPILIGLGSDKPVKAGVVSSNPIQLKFSGGGMTGEYFNFSGDLFIIHKDGRFTKLACKPNS